MQAPAAPQLQGERTSGTTTMVTGQPVGWVGEWHENPKPQWILPLSGQWFVEAMDGTRAEMGAGELSFGGDQNFCESASRRGHRSGTIVNEPSVLMVVQVDGAPPPAPACAFA